MTEPLSDFEAGIIFHAVHEVATGNRVVADGEIRRSAKGDFLLRLKEWGVRGVLVSFAEQEGGEARLTWRASRFAWGLLALDWLEGGGRELLGETHLHWIQGLLYGYAPDAIEKYFAKPSGSASSSQTSSPWRRAETVRPLTTESSAGCTTCTDKPLIPDTFLQSQASELLLKLGDVYVI